jgi:hypothetical protein
MISHVVLYTTYKPNIEAGWQLINEARRILQPLSMAVGAKFHVAPTTSFGRPVNAVKFDVGLYLGFGTMETYQIYMAHPSHLEWCEFVLRGWKLAGSTSTDTRSEFFNYILHGKPAEEPCRRERDATPDVHVVWDGEEVLDFGEIDIGS